MAFNLTVNGKAVTVDVPADMPLLWVIREVLNLPGTKFGCGMSLVWCVYGSRQRKPQRGHALPRSPK
jgi:hypothetical protein